MKKQLILWALIGLFAASFAACSKDDDNETPKTKTDEKTKKTDSHETQISVSAYLSEEMLNYFNVRVVYGLTNNYDTITLKKADMEAISLDQGKKLYKGKLGPKQGKYDSSQNYYSSVKFLFERNSTELPDTESDVLLTAEACLLATNTFSLDDITRNNMTVFLKGAKKTGLESWLAGYAKNSKSSVALRMKYDSLIGSNPIWSCYDSDYVYRSDIGSEDTYVKYLNRLIKNGGDDPENDGKVRLDD